MSTRLCLVFVLALCPFGAAQAPTSKASKPQEHAAAQSATPGDTSFFEQPPAGVDEALRQRLNDFYHCYVTGEFRKAYQFVADDSKDTYFESEKTRYKAFKIGRIDYSDNYRKAKVMVAADIDFKFQGQVFATTAPFIANWKFENGNWFWYVVPRKAGDKIDTPFGPMYTQKEEAKDPKQQDQSHGTASGPVSPQQALAQIHAMPTVLDPVVSLNPKNSYSNVMRIVNSSAKPMRIDVKLKETPGLTVSPSTLEIAPRKTGMALFKLDPAQIAGIKERTMVGVVLLVGTGSQMPMQLYVEMIPPAAKH